MVRCRKAFAQSRAQPPSCRTEPSRRRTRRAAQGAKNRRDGYYKMALEHAPEAHMSILLNQAQLLQRSGQPEKALAILEHMPGSLLNSPQVLRNLTALYTEARNWTALVELLPD